MVEEKKYRLESDLLGELKVPAEALYGVQTQRGINNYHISRKTMVDNPDFIIAIAFVKLAAIETNHSLGVINDEISGAIAQACTGGGRYSGRPCFLGRHSYGSRNRGLSNSPTGLIAYSADWRRQSRPVRVLYRPALT